MPLIECPDCGNNVSDSANICKQCGFPIAANLIVCSECKCKVWNFIESCSECGYPFDSSNIKNNKSPRKNIQSTNQKNFKPTYNDDQNYSQQNINITQTILTPESKTFAVITLILYIFLWPVGLFLNLIGLLTGPNRGCFVQLLIICAVIPIAGFLILLSMGINILKDIFGFF